MTNVFRWCEDGPVCIIAVDRQSALTALLQLIGQAAADPKTAKRLYPKSWTAQFGRDEFENGFIGKFLGLTSRYCTLHLGFYYCKWRLNELL